MRDFNTQAKRALARRGLASLLLAAPMLLLCQSAGAAVIDTDLVISGSVAFPDANPGFPNARVSDGNVTQAGDIHLTSGGVTTSGAFSTTPGVADGVDDGTTIGPATNPLVGGLTNTGDGIGYATNLDALGVAGTLSGSFDGYEAGVQFNINFTNTSATDTFTVTMRVAFDNSADADGGDSYAEIELDLGVSLNGGPRSVVAQSDLLSDTLFGDVKNGTPLATNGGLLTDIDDFTFLLVLAPGDTALIDGLPRWKGGVFESTGASLIDSLVDVTVADVACTGPTDCVDIQPPQPPGPPDPTGLPIPGSLLLLIPGLIGLGLGRRRLR
jgi:hypothetical protein